MGRPGATDDEVRAAVRALDLEEIVEALPAGLQTEVGEGGTQAVAGAAPGHLLSARAMLADPRILMLDEATSSIDALTELRLQAALARLLAGRTSVVIAHRLWTMRHADEVLVLDHGRVVERGTHRTLVAGGGIYAEMCRRLGVGGDCPRPRPSDDSRYRTHHGEDLTVAPGSGLAFARLAAGTAGASGRCKDASTSPSSRPRSFAADRELHDHASTAQAGDRRVVPTPFDVRGPRFGARRHAGRRGAGGSFCRHADHRSSRSRVRPQGHLGRAGLGARSVRAPRRGSRRRGPTPWSRRRRGAGGGTVHRDRTRGAHWLRRATIPRA